MREIPRQMIRRCDLGKMEKVTVPFCPHAKMLRNVNDHAVTLQRCKMQSWQGDFVFPSQSNQGKPVAGGRPVGFNGIASRFIGLRSDYNFVLAELASHPEMLHDRSDHFNIGTASDFTGEIQGKTFGQRRGYHHEGGNVLAAYVAADAQRF